MMFDFLLGIGNRSERLVANSIVGAAEIDTCRVTDGDEPFETGIEHPEYNDGKWVIVEAYPTRAAAEAGHARWVDVMSKEVLPDQLVDCQNAAISKFFGPDELVFKRVG